MNLNGGWNYWRSTTVLAAMLFLGFTFPKHVRGQQATGSLPQFEVSGAYSFTRAYAGNSNGGFNLNGGSASLAYNFSGRYSVVADFGGGHFSGLPTGVDSNMFTYLIGPRVSLRKSSRWTPFAQILVGAGRLNVNSSGVGAGESSVALAVGGGADLKFRSHISIRVIEADYLLTRFNGVSGVAETQNDVRLSTGIVFHFGSR